MSALQSKAKRSRAKPARRLRVLGSRASALRLHQKNLLPSETLCLDKPTRLTRRGFEMPISSEPAPSHRPSIVVPGATRYAEPSP